jgi:hypothetical protein
MAPSLTSISHADNPHGYMGIPFIPKPNPVVQSKNLLTAEKPVEGPDFTFPHDGPGVNHGGPARRSNNSSVWGRLRPDAEILHWPTVPCAGRRPHLTKHHQSAVANAHPFGRFPIPIRNGRPPPSPISRLAPHIPPEGLNEYIPGQRPGKRDTHTLRKPQRGDRTRQTKKDSPTGAHIRPYPGLYGCRPGPPRIHAPSADFLKNSFTA